MIALALALAAALPETLKTFGDWTVGCDNGRLCQAVGLMPADNFEAVTSAIQRGPEPGAEPVVSFSVTVSEAPWIEVDGRRFDHARVARDEGAKSNPPDTAAFIEALVKARTAAMIGPNGKPVGALSTAGASAALLYVDERQGRLGTGTALVRRGPRPVSAVPAPPPLPVISSPLGSTKPARMAAPADIVAARDDMSCETPGDEGEAQAFRLDAGNSLVLVPVRCGSGAYNFLSVALLVDEAGKARPAPVEGGEKSGENWLMNAEWVAEERRLSTHNKGRGIGDCGVSEAFAWDGTGFRLTEQYRMDDCRGSLDWIGTWRAEVRERR